ncbi:MAG: alpha/beta hydrolase [Actinomycetota bacterium]|nr:alpha/beta hydrolase [Actinomycetota bacterium]
MLPTLAACRQVIAVELQGHGRTADTDWTMSFDQLAGDVVALLAHLGIDEADIFGFSVGGLVGWSLVIGHPKLVRRFVAASADYRSRGGRRRRDPESRCPPTPTSRPCATPTRPSLPILRILTPSSTR